jgi:hypothetical protein
MMAATVPKVPLVFTPHFHAVGHTMAASALHVVYDPLAALLFRRADKVTCVSAAESELLLRRYPSVEPRPTVRSSWSLDVWSPTSVSTPLFGHSLPCVRTLD